MRERDEEHEPHEEDDRPPICPACGVTMGFTVDDRGVVRHVCLECGFGAEDAQGERAS